MHHLLQAALRPLVLLAAALLLTLPVSAQTETKITPNDPVAESFFGNAASLDGDRLLVGRYDNRPGSNDQAAYVFDFNGTAWSQTAKLVAPGAGNDDDYAFTVSLSGDRAVVGASRDAASGTDAGAVHVFDFNGTAWAHTVTLRPTDTQAGQRFGYTVSLDSDRLAVGAPTDGGSALTGAVYVFDFNGTAWSQTAKLSPGNAYDAFGNAVALDGDRLTGGAIYADGGSQRGRVYVYDLVANTWTLSANLAASDGQAYDQLGVSVALDGDRVVSGAYYESSAGSQNGAAYVFEYDGSAWNQTAKLLASDAASDRYVGAAVALLGDRALVGGWGTNYGSRTGSAYVFDYANGAWSQTNQLTPSDGSNTNAYGGVVSLGMDRAVVGALGDDAVLQDAGAVYVYDFSAPPPPNYVLVSDGALTLGKATSVAGDVHTNGSAMLAGHNALYTTDLSAVGSLDIGANLTIDGDATASGAITLGAGATVTGTTSANANVTAVTVPTSGPFSSGNQNVTVAGGTTRVLAPGSYRRVVVNGGGTLVLSAGTYTLDKLVVRRYGAVQANVANGAVEVNTRSSLVLANDTRVETALGGTLDDAQSHLLTLNSQQNTDVNLGARGIYVGTLNANGHVRIKADAVVRGSVRAASILTNNRVDLQAHATPVVLRQGAPALAAETHAPVEADTSAFAEAEAPEAFALDQNYPNPFNPVTTIRFTLDAPGAVRLTVFDAVGRRVATLVDATLGEGTHEAAFDARDLPSGLYLYQLDAPQGTVRRSMTLLR